MIKTASAKAGRGPKGSRKGGGVQPRVPVAPRGKHSGGMRSRPPSAPGPGGGAAAFDYTRPGDSVGARYETFLQAVDIVTSGLPVAAVSRFHKTSGLTMERIKQLARISEGSFARRKVTGRLSQDESERLFRLGRVFERAAALYDGDRDGAREWLETPIPSLGNQRPLDLARTEAGAREVEDLIGRIEHGVVS